MNIYAAPPDHSCDPDGYGLGRDDYKARTLLGMGSVWRCDDCGRHWVKNDCGVWRRVKWWNFEARQRIREGALPPPEPIPINHDPEPASLRQWIAASEWRAVSVLFVVMGVLGAAVATPIAVADGHQWWTPWAYMGGSLTGAAALVCVLMRISGWLDDDRDGDL